LKNKVHKRFPPVTIVIETRVKGEKNMADVRLKVSPPWVTFIHKVEALFDGDP
jgi:hypothetical protein